MSLTPRMTLRLTGMSDTDPVGLAGAFELCIVIIWRCFVGFCLRLPEASYGYWRIGEGSFPYNL